MTITIDTVLLGIVAVMQVSQFRILMSMLKALTSMDKSFQINQTIEYKVDQITAKLNVLEIKIERAK